MNVLPLKKSIIFVEGYKHEHYDKVIVYRNEAEYAQLQQLSNVKFAIKEMLQRQMSMRYLRGSLSG